jgi:hypothetical protein
MTLQEILEYNKKCAVFLGYKKVSEDKDFCFYEHPDKGLVFQSDNGNMIEYKLLESKSMRFHWEWNWIMAVIDAIESLDFSKTGYSWELDGEIRYNNEGTSVEIENSHCMIYEHLALDPIHIYVRVQADSKLEAVTKAIDQFIDLYNAKTLNN